MLVKYYNLARLFHLARRLSILGVYPRCSDPKCFIRQLTFFVLLGLGNLGYLEFMYHGNLRGNPPKAMFPPRNMALIRRY